MNDDDDDDECILNLNHFTSLSFSIAIESSSSFYLDSCLLTPQLDPCKEW